MASPAAGARGPAPALLLSFSTTRQTSLGEPPYDLTARAFLNAGHRVLSFDLPHHGERVEGYGTGIQGMCAAFLDGRDPFALFVRDGMAAVDACLERGLATAGRIYACGVSRGGYCALRLAAGDVRIAGVAGLAPVTAWRLLQEFEAVRERPEVAALDLDNWAGELSGRPVYLAIGNHDQRVGTDACVRLAMRLYELEQPRAQGSSATELHVVNSRGHELPGELHQRARALEIVNGAE